MMSSNKYNEQILEYISKIINRTYEKRTGSSVIDSQFINMSELIRFYNKTYGFDFQKNTLSSLKYSVYDNLLNEGKNKSKQHERDEDKQKDESIERIQNKDIEKDIQEQINRSKMPSDTINKEKILEELKELAEDEENITQKDIKDSVKAATIKAIYKATLEKYETNREEIKKHSDIVIRRDGDFALEDRLARENLLYEVYLNKLAKQYTSILPSHKEIDVDKKISEEKNNIKYKHNKEEQEKEIKRKKVITSIVLLQNERNKITKDMANPELFSESKYKELQERLEQIDSDINRLKPEVIIEGDIRDTKQETISTRELGSAHETPNASIAKTSKENEKEEEKNSNTIVKSTQKTLQNDEAREEELINRYYSCLAEGDYIGAKDCYQKLMSVNGSKSNLQNKIEDMTDDGKRDYKTIGEENNKLKDDLQLNKKQSDEELACIDAMTKEVEKISNDKGVKIERKENSIKNDYFPQHTLYGNKRPY